MVLIALLLPSLHPLPYHCCTASVAVIVAAVVWGVIIVIIFVVIFSCSRVSLHNRSKGLLPAGDVGKIGAIPNVGGGIVIDWHCHCNHCIHCCTAIVVAVAVAVVWGSSFHHLVHGCHCTREVRRCTLLPAGVAWKKVGFPNKGGG
jgi:hypothetical protein